MKGCKKSTIIYLFLILFFTNHLTLLSQEEKAVKIVISNDLIGNLNKTEVNVALDLWVKESISGLFKYKTVEVEVISSLAEIESRIKGNKVDIIFLFALDYIKLREKLPIIPFCLLGKTEGTSEMLYLVTNKNTNIKSIKDIENKTLLSMGSRVSEIVEKWLFVELTKAGIKKPAGIIKKFLKVEKPSKRLFQVFFNKADLCIVTRSEFESMMELNPQMRDKLDIIGSSPSFYTEIYTINKTTTAIEMDNKDFYISKLNQLKSIKELLKVVKARELIKYDESYFLPIIKLDKEYNALKK